MPTPMKDYYTVLRVDPSAGQEAIEDAYHQLALEEHPDRNPSPDATRRMQEINEAYEALHDVARRAEYDSRRRAYTGKGEQRETRQWTQARTPRRAGYEHQQWAQYDAAMRRSVDERIRKEWGNPENVSCPKCGRVDKVCKVSVISMHGLSSAELSRRLSLPASCRRLPWVAFLLIGLWSLSFSWGWLSLPSVLHAAGPVIYLVRFLSALVFVAVGYLSTAFVLRRYERIFARWIKLYFCEQDDGVFDPRENVLVPTKQMVDYLYR